MSVKIFSFNIDSNTSFVQKENGNILWYPKYLTNSSHIRFLFLPVTSSWIITAVSLWSKEFLGKHESKRFSGLKVTL